MRRLWKALIASVSILVVFGAINACWNPGIINAQSITNPAAVAIACATNTSPPSTTSGNFYFVQCNSSGQLVTATSSGSSTSVTQGTTPWVDALQALYPNFGANNLVPPAVTQNTSAQVPIDQNGALNVGFDGATFAPASVTSASVIFTQDMTGYAGINVEVTSAGTTCTITYQTSEDNVNWQSTNGTPSNSTQLVSTSTTTGIFSFPKRARYFRANVTTYTSGTVTVVYGLMKSSPIAPPGTTTIVGTNGSGSSPTVPPIVVASRATTTRQAVTSGQVVFAASTLEGNLINNPYAIPQDYLQANITIAGTSTTSTQVIGAAAAGIKNYVKSMQICTQGITATTQTLTILNGASAIWVMPVGDISGGCLSVPLEIPLASSAATAINAQLSASVTGGTIYINAQGYLAQ